jgi:hypothetical protein
MDSIRFNEELNKISQPEDSDAQFYSDPLAAHIIDLRYHSEFRGSTEGISMGSWKKNNESSFSDAAGSYPPGLYESKLPEHLEAIAYNVRPAIISQQQQQQQQQM